MFVLVQLVTVVSNLVSHNNNINNSSSNLKSFSFQPTSSVEVKIRNIVQRLLTIYHIVITRHTASQVVIGAHVYTPAGNLINHKSNQCFTMYIYQEKEELILNYVFEIVCLQNTFGY